MNANTKQDRPEVLHLPWPIGLLQGVEFPHKLGICDRLFGRSLAKHGVSWVRTAAGPIWKLDLANATHRWIAYGYYEGPGFWRWAMRHAGEVRHVVDSGANIGQTVLYFGSLFPNAQIWAYEPGSHARQWLTACVAANSWKHIHIDESGLGSNEAMRFLAADGDADRHGSWNKVNESEGEPIHIVGLDSEMEKKRISSIDLWKLDMEGYEIHAVKGAADALRRGRIRAIHCEMGPSAEETRHFLEGCGYTIRALTRAGTLAPWQEGGGLENALFLAPGHSSLEKEK